MASEDKQAAGSVPNSANAASNSSTDVALHPLVILSISDQFTRARLAAPADGHPVRVFGVLLGVQHHNGQHVELTNSFDVITTFDPNTGALVSVDEEFLSTRQAAFTKVFPDTTVLGWYQTGDAVSPEDIAVLSRALARYTETPLVALLDASRAYADETRDIPLQVFESELAGDSTTSHLLLKPVSYHVITVEAERIGVDHIAKSSTTQGTSQLSMSVLGMQGAMKMLLMRIQSICEYLQKVQSGEAKFDHAIMREIGRLCDLLPAANSGDFEKRFHTECSDVMLLTYLSVLTQGVQSLNMAADAHVLSHPNPRNRDGSSSSKHSRKDFRKEWKH